MELVFSAFSNMFNSIVQVDKSCNPSYSFIQLDKMTSASACELLFIDNYDSFSYNLIQYLQVQKAHVTVFRNDKITLDEAIALNPKGIVISPGPGGPADAGVSCDIIRHFAGKVPIFGVCLGMQCMYEVFGGVVGHAGEIKHGKTSAMVHDGKGIFEGA